MLKFFANIIFYMFFLLLISFFIQKYTYQDFSELTELKNILKNPRLDIILFGDSVIKTTSPKDSNKNNIGQFIEFYSNRNVGVLSAAAYQPKVFLAYSEFICKNATKPKLMIIPVNLRSFSLDWQFRPGYQFEYETDIIRNGTSPKNEILYKLNDLFNSQATNEQKKTNWEKKSVYYDNNKIGSILSFVVEPRDNIDLANRLKMQYGYTLDPKDDYLNDLRLTLNTLHQCGIKTITYITPLDMETASKYVDSKYNTIINSNIKLILSILDSKNNVTLDFSNLLKASDFYYNKIPNEHLNQSGRQKLARELVNLMTK